MGPLSGHCEINITRITCILQDNFDLFIDIISFQHVIHFDVEHGSENGNFSFCIGPKVTQNTIAIPI